MDYSIVASARECQIKCDDHELCQYFTWQACGKNCKLFEDCQDLNLECIDCYAGPRTNKCPY